MEGTHVKGQTIQSVWYTFTLENITGHYSKCRRHKIKLSHKSSQLTRGLPINGQFQSFWACLLPSKLHANINKIVKPIQPDDFASCDLILSKNYKIQTTFIFWSSLDTLTLAEMSQLIMVLCLLLYWHPETVRPCRFNTFCGKHYKDSIDEWV